MKAHVTAVAAGLCLIGAAGLLSLDLGPLDGPETQERRPEFYAEEILDHVNVVAPASVLGEADGVFAEIKPGGEMTVRMARTLRYSDASDEGLIVTKGDGRYGLAGLFRMTEEGESAWQPLAPGRTPGGFKFGPSMFPVAQSTSTLRIVNDDTRSVYVDAFVGYGEEEPAGPPRGGR